jgi:hypothetical protein
MIVFNVGDSHTTVGRWCVNQEDHYWHMLAQDMGATEIINESRPGRSNSSMIKSVIRHCLQNIDKPTYYFINITTIFRVDINDQSYQLHKILKPEILADLDFEEIECDLYAGLIGMMEFLKARNKKFLIINNGKNFSNNTLPKRDAYVQYFQQESRVLNWFDNSRIWFQENVSGIKPVDWDLYQWNGHDGPEAHLAYYKMLKIKLLNIK